MIGWRFYRQMCCSAGRLRSGRYSWGAVGPASTVCHSDYLNLEPRRPYTNMQFSKRNFLDSVEKLKSRPELSSFFRFFLLGKVGFQMLNYKTNRANSSRIWIRRIAWVELGRDFRISIILLAGLHIVNWVPTGTVTLVHLNALTNISQINQPPQSLSQWRPSGEECVIVNPTKVTVHVTKYCVLVHSLRWLTLFKFAQQTQQ